MANSCSKIIGFVFAVTLFSCTPSSDQNTTNAESMSLEENVRLAINPKFQDWVLFENGTYIIFENPDSFPDLEAEAIRLMKEYGPVHAGSPAGDFGVTTLTKTEGWVVSGHCYGMYTYVNPSELDNENPTDLDIGLLGRHKRQLDGDATVVVYINRKE